MHGKAHHSIFKFTVFTKTTAWQDYLDIQQKIFLEIAKIVKANNADFAFNFTTLYPAPNLKPEQLFPAS